MYSFTFGTFDGLFVECDEPAILPNDLSYFDLRRKNRRAIPNDNLPNVVIRKIESEDDENAGDILLIALVYKAMEGVREGFIAFGCILVEDINYENLAIALRKCIALANQSSSFFANGHLLSRPAKKNGDAIDLRDLPISGNAAFFGQLRESLDGKDAVKRIAQDAESLFENLSSFELVVNENSGLGVGELNEYFAQQVLEKEKLDRQRAQEIAKKQNEEKLAKFSVEQKPGRRLLDKISYVAAAISMALALVVGGLIYRANSVSEETSASVNRDNGSHQTAPVSKEIGPVFAEEEGPPSTDRDQQALKDTNPEISDQISNVCIYSELQDKLSELPFISTDLPFDRYNGSGANCVRLDKSILKLLQTEKKAVPNLIFSPDKKNIFEKPMEQHEWRLTSFQNFIDEAFAPEHASIFVDNEGTLSTNYTFVFSFTDVGSEKIYCSKDNFEETADSFKDKGNNAMKFYYFTTSSGPFEDIVVELTWAFQHQFLEAFRKVLFQLENGTGDYTHLDSFIRNTSYEAIERFDPASSQSTPFCVLAFTEQDKDALLRAGIKKSAETDYSFKETFERFKGLKALRSKIANETNKWISLTNEIPSCIALSDYVLILGKESSRDVSIKEAINLGVNKSGRDFSLLLGHFIELTDNRPRLLPQTDISKKIYNNFKTDFESLFRLQRLRTDLCRK